MPEGVTSFHSESASINEGGVKISLVGFITWNTEKFCRVADNQGPPVLL